MLYEKLPLGFVAAFLLYFKRKWGIKLMGAYLFVYGTLRKYEANHEYLQNSKCLANQSWVRGSLFDTGDGYPALVIDNEKEYVYGEVYEVDDEALANIDQLEDYKADRDENLYDRVEIDIYTDQGAIKGITYIAGNQCSLKTKIELGDWRVYQFLKEKPGKVYYFAYGSCMDQERFKQAKADRYFQKEVGAGILHGYSMKYAFQVDDGGRADIIEANDSLEGILYDCPQDAVVYLFKREGVYTQSYRPTFVDIQVGDQLYHSCLTFTVVHKKAEIAPPVHYAKEILRGSKGKVSSAYYKRLISHLEELEFDLAHQEIKPIITSQSAGS
ncbi:gamma-glutamylcyclotransferase [Bacillus litorisediminis]|uniref:gamma-glutamylcyclotransferase n=1 Tax=Bacillus litorisediminis TaxID=2922713 RepID=UPI001FB03DD8|nr:gamma-glutamylcyclotransferase [Bacillus litorisediminis]